MARRRFTADYKRRVLRAVDVVSRRGEIVALLRREGLQWSHIAAWRRARERGEADGLAPKKRGPKPKQQTWEKRLEGLERSLSRLLERLERVEKLCARQRKRKRSRSR
jgi:hypothetical protein